MKIVSETVFDKLVIDSLPGVFYVIDRSGRFIQWNRNLEKVTGYSAAEISRMSPLDFFSGDDKELIARKISEVFETGYTRVEAALVKKNGKKIPYIFSGKLNIISDQDYLIGEGLDITELKRAVYLFDSIMNSALTGIVIYGSNGKCLSASKAAGALLGAEKEQLLTQNFNKIKSWGKSGLLHAAKETLATGKPNLINIHIVTTFNKEVWLLCNLTRFYSDGKANLLAMFNDLTAAKQAEKALRESEIKYRQIMESANDAIFVADAKTGILIDVSKKATELIGMPLEKIIGMHQSKLHPADERESIARVFKEQVSKGSGIVRDFNAVNSSGESIPVEISASVMEQEGRIVIQGIFRDVTERRHSEKAIFEKDREIRRAYVDVLSAVTGGRLMIMDGDELSEALGKPISKSHAINSYKTLATARKKLSDTFGEYESANNGYNEFVFAANEALANAVKHGANGRYQVLKRGGTLQVLITDDGPGIDFSILPKATLIAGFSTKQSLGMGFSIMLDVCDKVLLSTGPGRTSVVLEKAISQNRANT